MDADADEEAVAAFAEGVRADAADLQRADRNGDQKLDFSEFCDLVRQYTRRWLQLRQI